MPQLNVAFIGGIGEGRSVAMGLLDRTITYMQTGQINEHNSSDEEEDYDQKVKQWSFEMSDWTIQMDEHTRDSIVKRLESGEWPYPHDYEFTFTIQKPYGLKKGQGLLDKIRKPDEIVLNIYEVHGYRVQRILDIVRKAKITGEITVELKGKEQEVLDTLLRADAFVFFINSEVFVSSSEDDIEFKRRITKYRVDSDVDLARLLEDISDYKQNNSGTIKKIAFMFAKHDRVMYQLNLKTNQQYENAIKEYMPTMYTAYEYIKQKYKLGDAFYVKSGIRTRDDEEEKIKKPDVPLRFYIRDYLDLMEFLVKVK